MVTLFARDTIAESNEAIASFNKILEAHNSKCIVWWKKATPIQALTTKIIEKSIRKSTTKKDASFVVDKVVVPGPHLDFENNWDE